MDSKLEYDPRVSEKTVAKRFVLEERATEGPLGILWRGKARGAGGFIRAVTIAELSADLSASAPFVESLARSAGRLMSRPRPNVEGVIDLVEEKGQHYLVLDAIVGPSLKSWVEACQADGEPAPWGHLLAIAETVLLALHDLHGRGLVHGGVSSRSIRLTRAGVPVLTRFGVAAACAAGDVGVKELRGSQTLSAADDVFSVGLVLYAALAGSSDVALLPEELRARLVAGKPIDLNLIRDDIPAVVLRTVERALRTAPKERFESALAMARSLRLILSSIAQTTDSGALAGQIEAVLPRAKPKGLPKTETDQLDVSELRELDDD